MFRSRVLLIFSVISCMLYSSESASQTAYLKTVHIGSTNPGFQAGDCPVSPDGYQYGWHFILSGTKTNFTSIRCTFKTAGIVTTMIQAPTKKHAYVFTSTADTILAASAIVNGPETEFVLSHVCSPNNLTNNSSSE